MFPTNSSNGHALPRLETSFSTSTLHSPSVTSSTSTSAILSSSSSTNQSSPSFLREGNFHGTASWPSSAIAHDFDSAQLQFTTSADGLKANKPGSQIERRETMPTIAAPTHLSHRRTSSLQQQSTAPNSGPTNPADSTIPLPSVPPSRVSNPYVFTNSARVSKSSSQAQPVRIVKAPKQRRRDNTKTKSSASSSSSSRLLHGVPTSSSPGPSSPSTRLKAPSPAVLQTALENQTQIIASVARQIKSASASNIALDSNLPSSHIHTGLSYARHGETLRPGHYRTGSYEPHSFQYSPSPAISSPLWPSSATTPYPPPWPSTSIPNFSHPLPANIGPVEAQYPRPDPSPKILTPTPGVRMPPPMSKHSSFHSSPNVSLTNEIVHNAPGQQNTDTDTENRPEMPQVGLGIEVRASMTPTPSEPTRTRTGQFMPITDGGGTLTDPRRFKGRVVRPWN